LSDESAEREQLLLDAIERTICSGTARMEYRFQVSLAEDLFSSKTRSTARKRGSRLSRLLRRLGAVAGRGLWWAVRRLVDRWTRKMAAQLHPGVVDFAGHRCMYGPYKATRAREEAVVVVEDRKWSGAPGTPLDRLAAEDAGAMQPLWLIDLLGGITEGQRQAREVLGGARCTRFAAHANLCRAGEALAYQVAVPTGIKRLGDLEKIPVELWIDEEGYLRRIQHSSGEGGEWTLTLDLSDFGIEQPPDWSRLPVGQALRVKRS
jgi:hypothetical protein